MTEAPRSAGTTMGGVSLATVSVVVAGTDTDALDLRELMNACRHAGSELLVVRSTTAESSGAWRDVSAPADASPAMRRRLGARAASGDILLFLNALAGPGYTRVLSRLERRRLSVVGSSRVSHPRTPADATPLSVIVPAYNASTVLPTTLAALRQNAPHESDWELVVVDDASTDDTAAIASEFADVVIRIPQRPHGPAYARNRGFEASLGAWAVFIDADVRVRHDTLERFASATALPADVGAIVGGYDGDVAADGMVSAYRTLLLNFAHRESSGEAETFWAACGAVRRDVFAEAGMYDEWHFQRPMVEGIELGQRIRGLGYRILVRPDILGTHVKKWSLLTAIIADLRDHAVPWMRLMLRQRERRENRMSLRAVERINRVGTWLALVALLLGSVVGDPRWVLTAGIALLPVVFANWRLYAFFERERGVLFTLAAIPLHLLYYVLLGIAAIIAAALHMLVGAPRPLPIVEAYAEMGVESWPPVPHRRTSSPRGAAIAHR